MQIIFSQVKQANNQDMLLKQKKQKIVSQYSTFKIKPFYNQYIICIISCYVIINFKPITVHSNVVAVWQASQITLTTV